MRNIALALLLAAGTALAAPAPGFARDAATTASSRAGFDTEKLKAITGWLQADVDKGRTPGAVVLIARDGQVVLHEAVGWADKDKKVPMQRNSIHAIASSTKLITTVAALRLFEQNRLQVMAPISQLPSRAEGPQDREERRQRQCDVRTRRSGAPADGSRSDDPSRRLHLFLLPSQSAARQIQGAGHRPRRQHDGRRDAAEAGDVAAGLLAGHLLRIFDRDRSARSYHRARHQEAARRRPEGTGAGSAQDERHHVSCSG